MTFLISSVRIRKVKKDLLGYCEGLSRRHETLLGFKLQIPMCGTYLETLTPKEYVGNQSDTFHPLFNGQEGVLCRIYINIMEQRSSQVFSFLDSHLL